MSSPTNIEYVKAIIAELFTRSTVAAVAYETPDGEQIEVDWKREPLPEDTLGEILHLQRDLAVALEEQSQKPQSPSPTPSPLPRISDLELAMTNDLMDEVIALCPSLVIVMTKEGLPGPGPDKWSGNAWGGKFLSCLGLAALLNYSLSNEMEKKRISERNQKSDEPEEYVPEADRPPEIVVQVQMARGHAPRVGYKGPIPQCVAALENAQTRLMKANPPMHSNGDYRNLE